MNKSGNNLVPRAHVCFGQRQDMELWNNQFSESKILGVPVSRYMRALVYMASRDKVDMDVFHKGIQCALGKLVKSKFGFERTAVSNFKTKDTWALGMIEVSLEASNRRKWPST